MRLLRVVDSVLVVFFFQAEDGIRDLVRSRGLGDVYKRQVHERFENFVHHPKVVMALILLLHVHKVFGERVKPCLLYTSDAADERSSVDLGGRRIIKKKTTTAIVVSRVMNTK